MNLNYYLHFDSGRKYYLPDLPLEESRLLYQIAKQSLPDQMLQVIAISQSDDDHAIVCLDLDDPSITVFCREDDLEQDLEYALIAIKIARDNLISVRGNDAVNKIISDRSLTIEDLVFHRVIAC